MWAAAVPLYRSPERGWGDDYLRPRKLQGGVSLGLTARLVQQQQQQLHTTSRGPPVGGLLLQGAHDQALDIVKSGLSYMTTGPEAGRCSSAIDSKLGCLLQCSAGLLCTAFEVRPVAY